MGGDEYRNFLRRGTFPSSLSAYRRPPDASAPSSIATHVIRRIGAEAIPCSTSPDDAVATAWASTRSRSRGETDCTIQRGIWYEGSIAWARRNALGQAMDPSARGCSCRRWFRRDRRQGDQLQECTAGCRIRCGRRMPQRIARSLHPSSWPGSRVRRGIANCVIGEMWSKPRGAAPTLLITQLAMLEGAPGALFRAMKARTRRADADGGERRAEGCLFKKISMLTSAEGSTVARGLSSPGCERGMQ